MCLILGPLFPRYLHLLYLQLFLIIAPVLHRCSPLRVSSLPFSPFLTWPTLLLPLFWLLPPLLLRMLPSLTPLLMPLLWFLLYSVPLSVYPQSRVWSLSSKSFSGSFFPINPVVYVVDGNPKSGSFVRLLTMCMETFLSVYLGFLSCLPYVYLSIKYYISHPSL